MEQKNTSFEANLIDLYRGLILNNTICKVQPSQTLSPRVIPQLPYSEEFLQYLNTFRFQQSDPNDLEYNQICTFFVENKHCYATRRDYVGTTSTPIRIRLKICYIANTKIYESSFPLTGQFEYNFEWSKKLWKKETHWLNASWKTKLWN